KDCNFVLTVRAVPSEPMQMWVDAFEAKVAEVVAQMQAIHPDTGIEYTRKFDVPGLKPEVAGEAEEIVRLLTGDNAVNVVSYATEAGQFQERGYSAVICGPGDIEQAHQPNEFITIEQFKAGEAFMERLLDSLA
ncbi:MAG: M20/M25/M40 family metallo-hydrolase, partial [Yoonia sp.]|uniref:M20/M25/M40 family metallo-hydrolase n=1 Tax=Yoonia sp. TaxID=2212373 RepID=UPI003EF0FC06